MEAYDKVSEFDLKSHSTSWNSSIWMDTWRAGEKHRNMLRGLVGVLESETNQQKRFKAPNKKEFICLEKKFKKKTELII